jgi:hypothetical protein
VQPVDPASAPRGAMIRRQAAPPHAQPHPQHQRPQQPLKGRPQQQQHHPDPAQGAVTHRSRTVLAPDGVPPKSDKLGLVFFIAGLGALVGAVAYAVWLWSSSQSPLVEVSLTTTPPGARIILDGADTGAATPHRFSNITGDTAHRIEFRLKGYQPCKKALTPTNQAKASLDCVLEKLP